MSYVEILRTDLRAAQTQYTSVEEVKWKPKYELKS